MEDKYDVIVIGTGCGGAAAGALAAYHGHKTLILEKNSIIGGRTATYEKQGFKMDHGHVMLRCDRGPHGKLLRMVDCPDLIPKYSYALDWGVQVSIADKKMVIPPHKRRAFLLLVMLKEIFNFRFKPDDWVSFAKFNAKTLNMSGREIEELYHIDAKTFLNRYFTNKYFHLIFGGTTTVCLGALMEEVSAGVVASISKAGLKGLGYPVNGEGVSAIPHSFLKAAKKFNAHLKLNTAVDEILVENNEVRGVMINGRFIESSIVISSVGIGETVLNLVGEDKFEAEYVERIKNLKYSYEGFSLKYALDKPVTKYPWGGEIPDNLEKITSDMSRGILPERLPWMYVAASSLDPAIAPKGKQAIFVISGGTPEVPGQVDWGKWMDKVKSQVAEFFPGINRHIIFCDETTPNHIASFSGRICGDAVGVAQTIDQVGELRPSPVSPIKGLFYSGADVGKDHVGTELATDGAISLEPYLQI